MDKKNCGIVNALEPVPLTVVSMFVNGKPNYILVGHVGVMDHTTLSICIYKERYSVKGIEENKTVCINLVDEPLIPLANEAARIDGNTGDKSQLFAYELGELGTPVIRDAPVSMECRVVDRYDRPDFYNYVCEIVNTYAREDVLTNGKIDLHKVKPILFGSGYCRTGEKVRKTLWD